MLLARGHDAPALSTSYVYVRAMLRKAEHFLRQAASGHLKEAELKVMLAKFDDGLHFPHFLDIVLEDGLVPEQAMPSTTCDAASTAILRARLTHTLGDALDQMLSASSDNARRLLLQTASAAVRNIIYQAVGRKPPTSVAVESGARVDPVTYRRDELGLAPKDLRFVGFVHDPRFTSPTKTIDPSGPDPFGPFDMYVMNEPDRIVDLLARAIAVDQMPLIAIDINSDNPHRVFVPGSKDVLSLRAFEYRGPLMSKATRLDVELNTPAHLVGLTGTGSDPAGVGTIFELFTSWGPNVGKNGLFTLYPGYLAYYIGKSYVPWEGISAQLSQRVKPLRQPKDVR